MRTWPALGVVLGVALLAGCQEPLTPQQQAVRTRADATRCQNGEASACPEACKSGGPNFTCAKACEADDGEACEQLAARYEREVDVPDPESPPRSIAPVDDERATEAHERACKLGFKQGCRQAAARILNGQGGKRPPNTVTDLLKTGCDQLQDADSCCAMAQLNFRLGQGRMAANVGIDFWEEGRRWAKRSERYGGTCPLPAGVK